ncbi:stress-responsive transcription factor hsf1, partial [Cladochytrium tenue]
MPRAAAARGLRSASARTTGSRPTRPTPPPPPDYADGDALAAPVAASVSGPAGAATAAAAVAVAAALTAAKLTTLPQHLALTTPLATAAAATSNVPTTTVAPPLSVASVGDDDDGDDADGDSGGEHGDDDDDDADADGNDDAYADVIGFAANATAAPPHPVDIHGSPLPLSAMALGSRTSSVAAPLSVLRQVATPASASAAPQRPRPQPPPSSLPAAAAGAVIKGVPAFPNKLYNMVNDERGTGLIHWSDDGQAFVVERHEEFAREVLPRFFKHSNFSSFVRQLNMYGFHKVPHLQAGSLMAEAEPELWEFANPHFQRNQPGLLSLVTRKKGVGVGTERSGTGAAITAAATTAVATATAATATAVAGATAKAIRGAGSERGGGGIGSRDGDGRVVAGHVDVSAVVQEIAAIKRHQLSISADLTAIQRENQVLWNESVALREHHQRQQDTIDKILRFLASIFSSPGRGAAKSPILRPSSAAPKKRKLLLRDATDDADNGEGGSSDVGSDSDTHFLDIHHNYGNHPFSHHDLLLDHDDHLFHQLQAAAAATTTSSTASAESASRGDSSERPSPPDFASDLLSASLPSASPACSPQVFGSPSQPPPLVTVSAPSYTASATPLALLPPIPPPPSASAAAAPATHSVARLGRSVRAVGLPTPTPPPPLPQLRIAAPTPDDADCQPMALDAFKVPALNDFTDLLNKDSGYDQ